jgi:predicted nucleic acid-binding protein
MTVVADTSPINYLIAIAQIGVLPKLYTAVLIPPTVKKELEYRAAPDADCISSRLGSSPSADARARYGTAAYSH